VLCPRPHRLSPPARTSSRGLPPLAPRAPAPHAAAFSPGGRPLKPPKRPQVDLLSGPGAAAAAAAAAAPPHLRFGRLSPPKTVGGRAVADSTPMADDGALLAPSTRGTAAAATAPSAKAQAAPRLALQPPRARAAVATGGYEDPIEESQPPGAAGQLTGGAEGAEGGAAAPRALKRPRAGGEATLEALAGLGVDDEEEEDADAGLLMTALKEGSLVRTGLGWQRRALLWCVASCLHVEAHAHSRLSG
jgi:hypothetical protein